MAKKTVKPQTPLTFRPRGRRKSLIEWNDPSKQAHVLDWRHRAEDFGLTVESRTEPDDSPYALEPEQMLQEDEPEAFSDQHVEPEAVEDESEQALEASAHHED